MPSSLQARKIRSAISPRFATSSFRITCGRARRSSSSLVKCLRECSLPVGENGVAVRRQHHLYGKVEQSPQRRPRPLTRLVFEEPRGEAKTASLVAQDRVAEHHGARPFEPQCDLVTALRRERTNTGRAPAELGAVAPCDLVPTAHMKFDRCQHHDRRTALRDFGIERGPQLVGHEWVDQDERIRSVEQKARDWAVRLVELVLFRFPLRVRRDPALQSGADFLDHAFFPGLSRFCGSKARLTAPCSSNARGPSWRASQFRFTKPTPCSPEIVPPSRSSGTAMSSLALPPRWASTTSASPSRQRHNAAISGGASGA